MHGRRACQALLVFLAVFFLAQVALIATQEWWRPRLCDPEYGCRLDGLRSRLAEAGPARPLIVALGNSRTAQGLRPGQLPSSKGDAETPILFNFAKTGSGPIWELLYLRRLLQDGVRPDLLLVEVWPPYLYEGPGTSEEKVLAPSRLRWRDLGTLSRYTTDPRHWYVEWLETRLGAWSSYSFLLHSFYTRSWLTPLDVTMGVSFHWIDEHGWMDPHTGEGQPDLASHQAVILSAHHIMNLLMPREYTISDVSRRAMAELLDICKRQRIPVALVFLPESKVCQGWYAPEVNAEVRQFLLHLEETYGIPVINARDWITDEMDFVDGYHLTPRGSTAYTRRLVAEALPALLGRERHAALAP
jgi:hypothetical protein